MEIDKYKLIFDQLLEKSEDGFIVINAQGVITDINEQYCDFLARKREDLVGKQIGDVISTTSMYDVLKQRYQGDSCDNVYFHPYSAGETRDNSELYAIANRFCIFDKEGNVIGAMAQMKFKDRALDIANELTLAERDFYKSEYQKNIDYSSGFDNILGNNKKMIELKKKCSKVAKTDFPVLITGETGTGKELFAKAIHMESHRRNNPLISINCGAIPAELMESELFGYEEGAFTGAKKGGKIGKFQLANNGTIFLDEIGDLPYPLQVKLLRVLQEKEVEPIGSTSPIPINVRVVSATRQNLQQMIKDGTFREDLYYRIAVVNIETIALREHKDDILLYANYCLEKLNKKYKTSIILTSSASNCLSKYSWPGNVREVYNVISSAFASCDGMTISPSDLPSKIANLNHNTSNNESSKKQTLNQQLNNYEASLIIDALNRNESVTEAAKDLGVERSLLYKKMKRLNISIQKKAKKKKL
ncbi:MAG: sigma 54-interacting transcriptional regulator [Tissierellia bacterium]|nr:sigma 54-interacting transcriptional regulator [Tissierellia bacterium]